MGLENDVLAGIVYDDGWLRRSKGEDKMFDVQRGQRYNVIAQKALDLFKELPEDSRAGGHENIILSLPEGTHLSLEVVDIVPVDGRNWCSVRIFVDEYEISGWVKRDSFVIVTPLPATGGQGAMPCYLFQFTGNMYSITYENLNIATLGDYKFIDALPKPTLQAVSIDNITYYTNMNNINDMMTKKLVTFIKKLI